MGKKHDVVQKKIVFIGDQGTGKSSILKNIKNGQNFITEQITANKYELKTKKGKTYTRISLWDGMVHGYRTDYRPIAYKNTDLIVIVYAIDTYKSFTNIKNVWIPEANTFAPNVPVMLIGTKSDARQNDDVKLVPYEDGLQCAEEIEASCFVECSALSESSLHEVVQKITDVTLHEYLKKGKECVVM